jgi:nucleotide-binding universal stress UspA family protein
MTHIIAGVDGSYGADRALRWAVHEARVRDASLEVLHVFVVHPYSKVFGTTDRDLARDRLDEIIERHRTELDRVEWSSSLVEASGATVGLLDAAHNADLVVVGARGTEGFDRLAIGSTGYRTAAHAPSPVAVVPEHADHLDGSRSVVVGLDESPAARRALRWAAEEAARRDGGLQVVHSYLLPVDMSAYAVINQTLHDQTRTEAHEHAESVVDEALAAVDVPDGVKVERIVALGAPAGVLLDHHADRLLVMGTRGQHAFGRALFGSVSQQVLHHAVGPVVIVP